MTEKTSVFDVAKWFLDKEDISPKRLQKLVYYVQAWSYALFDKPFMYEENEPAPFEAWRHGPVNPTLYRKYSDYGWQKIHSENENVKKFTNMSGNTYTEYIRKDDKPRIFFLTIVLKLNLYKESI